MTDATWDQLCGDLSWSLSQAFAVPQHSTAGQMTWTDGDGLSAWNHIERELQSIGELQDNWDNMGAIAPARTILHSAELFLRQLREMEDTAAPDMVMPGTEGAIIFAWHWGPGALLEAEISVPGMAEVFSKEPGMDADSWLYDYGALQRDDAAWEVSADAVTQAA